MAARDDLLAAALAHVTAHGIGEMSLRTLAAELGTSHRMLIYHFGSREGLLVAIVQAVEEQQRERLAALAADPDLPPAELGRRFTERFFEPALWPSERLFFELYGQALQGRPHAVALLDGIVERWLAPVADLLVRLGVPAVDARAHARLGVAVTRGLLLDLLATGDVEGVRAASELHMRTYDPLLRA